MYNGAPLTVVTRELAAAGKEGALNVKLDGTPQPAHVQGAFPSGGPHYIMGEFFDGKSHAVYGWTASFGANTFDLVGDVDLAAASGVACEGFSCFPVDWPQKGSVEILTANDFRGQETKQRDGRLWTTQTVLCNPGKGTRNCVRWAEIDPAEVEPGLLAPSGFPLVSGTSGVKQAGVFGSDWGYRAFPSIAVNACGDMAVGDRSARRPATRVARGTPPSTSTAAPRVMPREGRRRASAEEGGSPVQLFPGQRRAWCPTLGRLQRDGKRPGRQDVLVLRRVRTGQHSQPLGKLVMHVGSFRFNSCE